MIKILAAVAAVTATIMTIGTFSGHLWSWQPFALAGQVAEYRNDQLDTAIELYQMQESDLVLKGGAVQRQLQKDEDNQFLYEQKQIIERDLERTRSKRRMYQKKRIEGR